MQGTTSNSDPFCTILELSWHLYTIGFPIVHVWRVWVLFISCGFYGLSLVFDPCMCLNVMLLTRRPAHKSCNEKDFTWKTHQSGSQNNLLYIIHMSCSISAPPPPPRHTHYWFPPFTPVWYPSCSSGYYPWQAHNVKGDLIMYVIRTNLDEILHLLGNACTFNHAMEACMAFRLLWAGWV